MVVTDGLRQRYFARGTPSNIHHKNPPTNWTHRPTPNELRYAHTPNNIRNTTDLSNIDRLFPYALLGGILHEATSAKWLIALNFRISPMGKALSEISLLTKALRAIAALRSAMWDGQWYEEMISEVRGVSWHLKPTAAYSLPSYLSSRWFVFQKCHNLGRSST